MHDDIMPVQWMASWNLSNSILVWLENYSETTVKPPNKGHIGNNINSEVVSFVERLFSGEGSKCIRTVGNQFFGTLTFVLCGEVYYTVTLFQRAHYLYF